MAQVSVLPLDHKVCQKLSENLPPKKIANEVRAKESDVIDVTGAMLARAFGRKIPLGKEHIPDGKVRTAYNHWREISLAIHECVKKKIPVETSLSLKRRLGECPLLEPTDVTFLWEAWKKLGMTSERNHVYKDPPPELVPYAVEGEKSLHELAITLYAYLDGNQVPENLSYQLLPLVNSVAVKTPSGSLSWFDIVMLYGAKIPGKRAKVAPLLQAFPFYKTLCQLQKRPPNFHPSSLNDQSFKEFTIKTTLLALEKYLGHDFSSDLENVLFKLFCEEEELRKDLMCFVAMVYKRMKEKPFDPLTDEEISSLKQKPHSKLYFSFLMALRIAHVLIPEGKQEYPSDLIDWAFTSNRKYVQSLDFFRYDPPNAHNANRCYFNPQKITGNIHQLKELYKHNGENYEENALNLAMGLLPIPIDEHTFFVVQCGACPHAIITTKQVLDYFILDDYKSISEMQAVLRAFQELIPSQVKGRTKEFFNSIPKGKQIPNDQIISDINTFNELLAIGKEEEVSAELYFKALGFYMRGRIIEPHFNILNLYKDEYPSLTANDRLDLLIRATDKYPDRKVAYLPGTEEIDLKNSDPLNLFDSIHVFRQEAAAGVKVTLAQFIGHFNKGAPLENSLIKSLFRHPLSPLPKELKQTHLDYCINYIKKNEHPFTKEQQLYIFHELLSLQDEPAKLLAITEFIPIFEVAVGTTLDSETVMGLLTYHPTIDINRAHQCFNTIRSERKKIVEIQSFRGQDIPGMIENPILNPRVMANLSAASAEIREMMEDPKREKELEEDPLLTSVRIYKLQEYLQWATAPITVTHLTRNFPKGGEVILKGNNRVPSDVGELFFPRLSAHQALLPVDTSAEVGKSVWGSWEAIPKGFLFRFALVSTRDQTTFSGRIFLEVSPYIVSWNPLLFETLRKLSYTVLNDIHWDRFRGNQCIDEEESYQRFERRESCITTLRDFLDFYQDAQKVWDAFDPFEIKKEDLEPLIFQFLADLKVAFRKAVFSHVVNLKGAISGSPFRLSSKFSITQASEGEIHPFKGGHQILPIKYLDHSPSYTPYYSTWDELMKIFGPNLVKASEFLTVISNKGSLALKELDLYVTKNNLTPHILKLKLTAKPMEVDYYDKDIKKITGEANVYQERGYTFQLTTTFEEIDLSINVFYPLESISTPDSLVANISRHIAQLKSRFYETLIALEEMLPDHHSPSGPAYETQTPLSQRNERRSDPVKNLRNPHKNHEQYSRSWHM